MLSYIYEQMFKNKTNQDRRRNLEKSFHQLTVKENYDVKDCSPSLKNLHNRTPKVKRLSKAFEKIDGEYHKKCNWWLDTMTPPPPPLIRVDCVQSKVCNQLMDILEHPKLELSVDVNVKKLLLLERKYVSAMGFMIRNYVNIVDYSRDSQPLEIRWKLQLLFGNMREIYEFHKTKFLPKLLACYGDVEQIAELFISSINDDSFYNYVSHLIVEKSSENWRKFCGKLFKELHKNYGIAFRFNPMEHLLEYKKFLREISSCLHNDFDKNHQQIVAIFDAENCLQKLIDQVMNASFVHKITEINQVSIETQNKLKTMIESNEETIPLFLVPRKDCFYGYCQPINIMKLGKFLKLDKISMRSSDCKGFQDAHFFVFERCLIYTVASQDSFLFTGNFWLKTTQVGSIYNVRKGFYHITLKDRYRTVILETSSLLDLIIELKAKSDKDPYDIPKIFLSEKQLKTLYKLIERDSNKQLKLNSYY
ncbi:unnamed protein product [Diamesa serratosioi]